MPKVMTEVDREMAARLRQRRLELGLTQTALADVLGVSFQQVQKYEKGKDRIKAGAIGKLAEALKMSIGELLGNAPRPGFAETAQAPYGADPMVAAEAMQLNRAFLRITDPLLRRSIVELATRIAESAQPRPARRAG